MEECDVTIWITCVTISLPRKRYLLPKCVERSYDPTIIIKMSFPSVGIPWPLPLNPFSLHFSSLSHLLPHSTPLFSISSPLPPFLSFLPLPSLFLPSPPLPGPRVNALNKSQTLGQNSGVGSGSTSKAAQNPFAATSNSSVRPKGNDNGEDGDGRHVISFDLNGFYTIWQM